MPRARKSSPAKSASGDNGMPTFVNVNLSDEQKAFVKGNLPSVVEVLDKIEDLLADNYKLTVSFDDTTDCYAAYLIGKDNQVTNAGLMLSAYAPVLMGVFAMLLYKHYTVLQEDWTGHTRANTAQAWR